MKSPQGQTDQLKWTIIRMERLWREIDDEDWEKMGEARLLKRKSEAKPMNYHEEKALLRDYSGPTQSGKYWPDQATVFDCPRFGKEMF
ncbi:hypothetical protein ACFL0Y_00360 [Patescibacteria group bacterium]